MKRRIRKCILQSMRASLVAKKYLFLRLLNFRTYEFKLRPAWMAN